LFLYCENKFSKFTYSSVVNINYARSEILAFLNKLLIFFFNKAYYQESNILIIADSSVVTVAEWLDGSFENQNSL
jgi:hypothetical protein